MSVGEGRKGVLKIELLVWYVFPFLLPPPREPSNFTQWSPSFSSNLKLGVAARCDLAAAVQEVVAAEADPNSTLAASHTGASSSSSSSGTTTAPAPPWLSSELRDVYDGAASATAELAAQPKQLQYISGVLTDLFVDWRKLAANEDARSKIPALHHLLAHDYSLEHLEHMFGLRAP